MWTKKKKQRAIDAIITYGGPHRRRLVRGGLATIGVVFFRLAMPWPLRGVVEVVFPRGSHSGRLMVDYLPGWGDPVLWLGGVYLLLALGLGVSEYIQRVDIMRFAAGTVHDMRAAAVRAAKWLPLQERATSGDLIARIIGDSARIKAGLSGIMVHGLQNGLLFLAVCLLLLYISLPLGMVFLVAGVIALYIGLTTSTPVAETASKHRSKEGDYAAALQEGLETGGLDLQLEELNSSSARKEVKTTRLIARSSLFIHVVLAAAVGLALWVGAKGVTAGMIAPGELFLFIAYALTVHRRMVQVGRQSARTGKVLACANRIGSIISNAASAGARRPTAPDMAPLESGLRLEEVKVASDGGRGGRPRLRRTDLSVHPETRVAVLGSIGSGKSTLLRVLAGVETPDKGKVFWDGEEVSKKEGTLASRVAYLRQYPVFPPTHIWKTIGLREPGALTVEQEETLRRIEAWKVIQSFSKGVEKKVGSSSISRNEARILRLAGILLGSGSSVWLLDNPVQGFARKRAKRCLGEILKCATDRTVVIALAEPLLLDRFDRVLFLRGGKVRFDGTPAEWEEWRRAQRRRVQS
ncbi:MAG: ATP-binding cassette domain-containing protein [Thermodesulfobacteriota bacterium]